MLLVETLRKDLSLPSFHRQRVCLIDEHDFEGVKRKTQEELAKLGLYPNEEYLEAGILALKQYYAIALLDGRNMHAVSEQVDPFWHAHILHTKSYAQFCDSVVGGFMHHDPLDHGKMDDVRFIAHLYNFTMERYKACFEHVDRRFYPEFPDTAELVCSHANDIYDVCAHAIFPRESHAQPPASWAH